MGGGAPKAPPPPLSATVVRPAPGLSALFETVEEDGTHRVLDLGTAAEASLRLYGRLARRVRFADLAATPGASSQWSAALEDAQPPSEDLYDLLLLWDTLAWLSPEERPRMVARLAAASAPGARLHMIVEAPERTGPRPLRFTLMDPAHVRLELGREPGPAARLLPSDVERVLAPFRVVRAFTLKGGFREYVAVLEPPATPPAGPVAVRYPGELPAR